MYILFAGVHEYPLGGMRDYVGIFPTREAAREASKEQIQSDLPQLKETYDKYDWYQIAKYECDKMLYLEYGWVSDTGEWLLLELDMEN